MTQQPAALLTRANRLLFPELSGVAMFITAQLVLVDARARTLTIANAGHCPLLVAGDGAVKSYSPEGMPLGVLADSLFEDEKVELPENGCVLLYSDGVTDAQNPRGEKFGNQALADWLAQSSATRREAGRLRDDLVAELEKYQSGAALADDQTFMLLRG